MRWRDPRFFKAVCGARAPTDRVGHSDPLGVPARRSRVRRLNNGSRVSGPGEGGRPPRTFTSMMSCDSRSAVNLENGMSFVTPNVCLEASSLERE